MTLPAYPEYRESNVDWLDAAPCHWTDTRLRFVARLNPSKSEVADRDRSEEVSFLPMDAVGDDGSLRLDETRPLGEVETGYTYFREGDVAVAKITPCFENGKGAVMRGLVGGVGFGTTELIVARPLPGHSQDFLYWLFTSAPFRKFGEGSMYGAGGQKRVPDDFVRDFRVALPPPDEQAVIAAFLDRETGKIDALVEAQRQLIDLLKEKRQAAITRAVTKGLDPTVPMADSRISWLGRVPAHWDVKRLRFICDISTGDGDTVDAEPDGEFPFYVRSPAVERIGRFTHDCEAVLTSGDGAGVGKIFHYVTGKFAAHQRVYIFNNFRDVAGEFFFHYLRENFFKVALEGGAKSTVDSLRRPLIANFWMTVPPIQEQEVIVEEVERVTGLFDALTGEAKSAIGLLQERRAALISAAVMGRIDVRCHAVLPPVVADQATARRLVGAAVLELVADTPASSRMTSAKRMYLAEAHAGVWELRGKPQRMAAGPFDGALMSEVEAELARVGHIATSQPGGPNSKVHYRLSGHRGALRAELDALLGDRRAAFDKMLTDLGELESKGVEAVATLYAVWNDMLIDGKTPTDDAVIDGVLNDWHAEKRDKFTKAGLRNYLGWMGRHGMTPKGRGPRTQFGTLL